MLRDELTRGTTLIDKLLINTIIVLLKLKKSLGYKNQETKYSALPLLLISKLIHSIP